MKLCTQTTTTMLITLELFYDIVEYLTSSVGINISYAAVSTPPFK